MKKLLFILIIFNFNALLPSNNLSLKKSTSSDVLVQHVAKIATEALKSLQDPDSSNHDDDREALILAIKFLKRHGYGKDVDISVFDKISLINSYQNQNNSTEHNNNIINCIPQKKSDNIFIKMVKNCCSSYFHSNQKSK